MLTITVEPPSKRAKKVAKNPMVDTSFLPDREREQKEREMREALRQEWLQKQEEIKAEEVEVVYSYWDGSGHRKSVRVSIFLMTVSGRLDPRANELASGQER
jgi:hypothetical protein